MPTSLPEPRSVTYQCPAAVKPERDPAPPDVADAGRSAESDIEQRRQEHFEAQLLALLCAASSSSQAQNQ